MRKSMTRQIVSISEPNVCILLGFKQGVKLMVVAARSTDKTQSNVRAKLLFLGGLIAQGNEKAEKALGVS